MRTIGVDTGGTFTDLVLREGEELRVVKLPSTPAEPARAVHGGLARLGPAQPADHVIHGTTVALNALLTGRVARVALVTGEGFADLIEIGRQARPEIYELHPVRPRPLVPRELRFEIPQRSWPDPDSSASAPISVREPSADELDRLRRDIAASGAESVAVCLLHSFADPEIELRVARALEPLGLPVTCSAELLPEHREYERFSTAVVNAALQPLMAAYLGPLERDLGGARLSILQSSGGTLPAQRAGREPARVILSGPAGGVVGAARAAAQAGLGAVVALDMGGTSTDVAFHGAELEASEDEAARARTVEPVQVAGYPVGIPALDIHTIGCGGGSLVEVDSGGVLHVGPKSAGADPGPVCYGSSDRPTVTDAHAYLGHIASGRFLENDLVLDLDATARAFEQLGRGLGVRPRQAARGVLEVARAAMRRAIGVMTLQRGQDPRRLPLVAFGGAGGLHGAALAESLAMPAALIPRHPGALSAWGMANAEAIRDLAYSPMAPLAEWPAARRRRVLAELAGRGREELVGAGHARSRVRVEHSLDLRYQGQSFELRLPASGSPERAFHDSHERLYGYRLAEREVELVCLRTRATVPGREPERRRVRRRAAPPEARVGTRSADFGRALRCPVIARAALGPGHALEGPALVEEYSGTCLVPPGWSARVTAGGHLLLERG